MTFSKSSTRFTTSVRTGTFLHPTYRIRTTINHCFKLATSNAQQRGEPQITMLRRSASLMRLEAKSLRLSLEQHARFREQETLRSQEQQAILSQHFEDQLKRSREQQDALLQRFQEQEQQCQKRVEQKNIQNHELLVRSSLYSFSTDFLIFQQCAALEERTERMKLEGNYNVRGALGVRAICVY